MIILKSPHLYLGKALKNIYFTILQDLLCKLLKLFIVITPQLKHKPKKHSGANII